MNCAICVRNREIGRKRSSTTERGQHSIRINDQFHIFFAWNGQHAKQVEIVDSSLTEIDDDQERRASGTSRRRP